VLSERPPVDVRIATELGVLGGQDIEVVASNHRDRERAFFQAL
jgi:hypothetical protein